jgi:hypothetical protein
MKKYMLIISAGPGLSRSVAEKFGKEGCQTQPGDHYPLVRLRSEVSPCSYMSA